MSQLSQIILEACLQSTDKMVRTLSLSPEVWAQLRKELPSKYFFFDEQLDCWTLACVPVTVTPAEKTWSIQ